MALLEVKNLKKVYTTRFTQNQVQALTNVNFSVNKGEYVAIMGESGSGKTTLLNILAALDKPTSGQVLLHGKDITHISEKEIANFRREHLGFVFQDFNLLDTFNVADNIYLPLVLSKEPYALMKPKLEKLARPLGINHLLEKYPYEISGGQKQRVAVARALITHPIAKQLGIEGILDKFPYEISGGQKQRVAVARAIITNPDLILADEPTGALDSKSTEELLHLFGTINANQQTIVMVTHSTKAASHASRVLFIKDGKIFHEIYKGNKNLDQMYQCISDTLTLLATGGVHHE